MDTLRKKLEQAETNLESWVAKGDCDDQASEDYLKGKIDALREALAIIEEEYG